MIASILVAVQRRLPAAQVVWLVSGMAFTAETLAAKVKQLLPDPTGR